MTYFHQGQPPIIPSPPRRAERSGPARSYRTLFRALSEKPGAWIGVDPNHVTGDTRAVKVTILHAAARSRKLRIQTTFQDGVIYLRLIAAESNDVEV